MDLDKIYYDPDGNETNILTLVTQCPEWAASRIQHMEKELENCVPCDSEKYHCEANIR